MLKNWYKSFLACAALLIFCAVSVQAAPTTVSTGDLGYNVIYGGGFFDVFFDLNDLNAALPAQLDVKYGLWNSPDVNVFVSCNSVNVGNFLADNGYISPGPDYFTTDVTGLLINGNNQIRFNGFGNGGDYVVGKVDLTYNSKPVPEPATMLLLGSGLIGMVGYKKKNS